MQHSIVNVFLALLNICAVCYAVLSTLQQQDGDSSSSRGDINLHEVFSWKQVDFNYPSPAVRQFAIETGDFVPENAINPIGVAASGSRVFISMPRWKNGVPATLATVPFPSNTSSPLLSPYPDWAWSRQGNCDGLTSVYRVKVDECGRLWAVDTGVVNSFVKAQRICPPQVVAFDLNTDKMVHRYRLPEDVLRPDSLPGAIEVEYPAGRCGPPSTAVVYTADVTTYTLIVSDLSSGRSWRVRHRTMYPSPEAGVISINNETLELMDGIVGLTLSPSRLPGRILFYYPLSGFKQHWVQTAVLRNASSANTSPTAYHSYEDVRSSQSVGCSMDQSGVMFFGLLNSNAIACWDSNKPFNKQNVVTLAQNDRDMQYVATTMVDGAGRLWAISTRVHTFFKRTQDPRDVNYRVFMAASSSALVRDTACEPHTVWPSSSGVHDNRKTKQ